MRRIAGLPNGGKRASRPAIISGASGHGRLDVDVSESRRSSIEPVGPPGQASVDRTKYGIDSIAVAPGVLEPFEHKGDSAVTRRRARTLVPIAAPIASSPSLRPDRASSSLSGQNDAKVARKIDGADDRRIELAPPSQSAAMARAWMPEVSSQET